MVQLFDLLLYRYKELQQKAFAMIINYFTRRRIMIESLCTTQILESDRSISVMNQMKDGHAQLSENMNEISFWLMNNNPQAQTMKNQATDIFVQMTKFCVIRDVTEEAMQQQEDEDVNMTLGNRSGNNQTLNTTEKKAASAADRLKKLRQRKTDIEEFILFDIENNNSTPNKENQRLLQAFNFA